jgi:chemotaxis protein methyltransferase CheR
MAGNFGGFGNRPGASSLNFGFSKAKKKELSPAEFDEWRKFIYELTGIYFQDNKKYLLESRLLKRVNFLKLNSFKEYLEYLKKNRNNKAEYNELFEVITINETFFFRNQPQLDALVTKVIPEIMAMPENRNKTRIKIWSAACSSGEEPYSVAITIKEMIQPKYPNVRFEIVGTDINYQVLNTARSGIYKEYAVRNTPPYYIKKYFKAENGRYILSSDVKRMVTFKILNLADDMEMRRMRDFDVIFCANVLIYFDKESKMRVVNHLYNALNKGGYLFIGYSETLHGISKAFKLVSFPKTVGYKKE